MDLPELLVLRHGQTEWNLAGRMQGHLDSPLTALGKAQARRQSEILADLDLADWDLFCSPQGRAKATADIVFAGQGLALIIDERLAEIGVGTWAGQTRDARQIAPNAGAHLPEGPARNIALYDFAPDGEGFTKLRERAVGFLGELRAPSVIVTHGVTSRMLRLVALGLPSDALGDLPGGQGVVHHIKNGTHNVLK